MSHNLKISMPHGPEGARVRMALVKKQPAGSNLEDTLVSEHTLKLEPHRSKKHDFSISVPHGHYLICEPLQDP